MDDGHRSSRPRGGFLCQGKGGQHNPEGLYNPTSYMYYVCTGSHSHMAKTVVPNGRLNSRGFTSSVLGPLRLFRAG